MRYFLRPVLACFVIVFGFSSSVVILSRAQPVTDVLPELRRCGPSMCLFNIQPDVTTLDDANRILKSTGQFSFDNLPRLYKQSYPFYGLDLLHVEKRVGAVPGSVMELDLHFRQLPEENFQITAASIVNTYGPPCAATSSISARLVLFYPGMVLFFETPIIGLPFEPEALLRQINMWKTAESCSAILKYAQSSAWRGFATYPVRP